MSSGDKITLDRETFKVLASETRVEMLKELDRSQRTVSDLARALGMNKATCFEHLEKMIDAGLIKKTGGEERKWVYYKLTWKGKNILHPERTKIMIALGVFLACFVVALVVIIILAANAANDRYINPPPDPDRTVPSITLQSSVDVTNITTGPVRYDISVYDAGGIDASTFLVEFVISPAPVDDPAALEGWMLMDSTLGADRLASAELTGVDWSLYPGQVLYIRVTVSDWAGNTARTYHTDHVDRVFADTFDLSVGTADLTYAELERSGEPPGSRTFAVKAAVHNTGSLEVANLEVGFYDQNPDADGDGLVDDAAPVPVQTLEIPSIGPGEIGTAEFELTIDASGLDGSGVPRLWVVVDPSGRVNETNEKNNIAKAGTSGPGTAIPEFSDYALVALMVLIAGLFVVVRRARKRKG